MLPPTDPDLPASELVTSLPLERRVTLLSGSDVWHTEPVGEIDLPPVMMTDGPHGLRKQEESGDHLGVSGSKPATCFPTAVTLASSWDEELVAEVGEAVGREAAAEQIAVVLGPGLNIKRHPNCGRNFEYLSEDPLLSGRLAAALVSGIQSQGVGACLKHFAVNNQESHRLVVDVVIDERTLREIYLAGFEHAVTTARPWTVMAAYNSVNGTYCCDHQRLLTRILRDEWRFDGLVMSDWGATNDRVAGVHAGMDLEMPSSSGVFDGDVVAAVRSGDLAEPDVTTCAARVVELVRRSPTAAGAPADLAAHHTLARWAAAAGSVLLTNDGLLPLDPGRSVAVIGAFAQQPRYQGFGSSLVNPTRLDRALEAIRERAKGAVEYAAGYDPATAAPDPLLVAEAEEVSRRCDTAVLLVGLPGVYESEGFDRTDLHLPRQHEGLIARVCRANPRTVVVLANGAPVAMPWADQPAAILESYLGGQAGGGAVADVLFGDVEPGGRLAETFPLQQADVPSDPWFPGPPRQVEYREGIYVGYRYYATAGVGVRFPFGHGLGYTTFAYSDITADTDRIQAGEPLTVRATVTNTGGRAGSEVVQVYVHDGTGVIDRPARELKAFTKVRLAPGESSTVEFRLDARAFAYYDVADEDWRVPAGEFRIDVGSSSVAIAGSVAVIVVGGKTRRRPPRRALVAATDDQFQELLGRPIPVPVPERPFTRLTTVGELRATRTGRLLRAGLHRFTRGRFEQMAGGDTAMADGLSEALDMMPLRGVVLFADGKVPWPVLDAIVDTLNGRLPGRIVAAAGAAPGAVVSGIRSRTSR